MKKTLGILLLIPIFSSCTIVIPVISESSAKNTTKIATNNTSSQEEINNINEDINNADFIEEVEKNIVLEINALRTNPTEYAKKVKKYMGYIEGKFLKVPEQTPLVTIEGIKAFQDCYDELLKTKPMGALTLSKGLSLGAKDHIKDTQNLDELGHTGTDGSSSADRASRYGEWGELIGENIEYGSPNAEQIIISLIVDDGVSNRGHRKNILNPNFNFIGVAFGEHKNYKTMTVMDFAGDYKEKN